MNIKFLGTTLQVGAFGLAMALGLGGSAAHASDIINVTYLNPGYQSPSAFTQYYETFDSLTATPTGNYTPPLTTTFNGSNITGTYTGTFAIHSASVNGGAGNTGNYILAPGSSMATYTLMLSQGVNYFGIWISALDSGNTIKLYNGSTLLYTFPPSTLITNLGSCTNPSTNHYCGNPNNPYKTDGGSGDTNTSDNNGQQYAYVNFYDVTGDDITKIVFTQTNGGANFESDNQSAAILTTAPGGTPLGTNYANAPEPSSLMLMGTGLLGAIPALRRRRSSSAV